MNNPNDFEAFSHQKKTLTESVDFDLFPNQENLVKEVAKEMRDINRRFLLAEIDFVNTILEGFYKILKTLSKMLLHVFVIFFVVSNFYDTTYYKSIIDKVVNVFTQTDGSAWRVQLIWAFVIVGIWGSAKVVGLLRLLWGIKSDRF